MTPRLWRLWRFVQHLVGGANTYLFVANAAAGSYLMATASLLCVFLTASWRMGKEKS